MTPLVAVTAAELEHMVFPPAPPHPDPRVRAMRTDPCSLFYDDDIDVRAHKIVRALDLGLDAAAVSAAVDEVYAILSIYEAEDEKVDFG